MKEKLLQEFEELIVERNSVIKWLHDSCNWVEDYWIYRRLAYKRLYEIRRELLNIS